MHFLIFNLFVHVNGNFYIEKLYALCLMLGYNRNRVWAKDHLGDDAWKRRQEAMRWLKGERKSIEGG